MTYTEAVKAKENLTPENYMGSTWSIFIVPENPIDFEKYIQSIPNLFIHNLLTDNHAALFSSDNSYSLRGLCYKDGMILHRSINVNT